MLYHLHELARACIGPMVQLAQACAALHAAAPYPPALTRDAVAACELVHRPGKTYTRPGFGIDSVDAGGRTLRVSEQLVAERPFCRLVHFQKERAVPRAAPQPALLLVAPLAGHHASLLRETVRELLQDHDVFITDWVDAKVAPLSAGEFGLDDYVQYLRQFIAILPPALHIVAAERGHYATFSGRHWRHTICPAIRDFIGEADSAHLRTHAVALQAA